MSSEIEEEEDMIDGKYFYDQQKPLQLYSYNEQLNGQMYDEEEEDMNNNIVNNYSSTESEQEQDHTENGSSSQSWQMATRQSSTIKNFNSHNNLALVQHTDKPSKKQQQCIIVNIPFSKYLTTQREYLLNGDIYINFGDHEFNRIGTLNKFKKMSLLQIDRNIDQLNIHMSTSQKGMDEFKELIQFCSSQPHKMMKAIAEQLQLHQIRVDKIRRFSQTIQQLPNFDQFVDASEKCYQNFKQNCQIKLVEMIQNCTIKFYKTKYVKIDYVNGCYELECMAMSQVLLALLGISQEQARQFILRKGMFEFVFSLEEFGHELHFLNLYNENISTYSSESMIKTFDGIDLQTRTNFHIFYNKDNAIIQKAGFKITEFFMIVDYDITPNMLRQVVEIRKKEPSLLNITYLENEQDWDYSEQSKQFIQQFYPHKL